MIKVFQKASKSRKLEPGSIFLLESMRDEESTSNQKYQLGISSLQQCIEGFDVIGFSKVFDGIK